MTQDVGLDDFDQLVLDKYPYPIALYYQKILKETDWEKKTRLCIWTFDLGLRLITLSLASQYVTKDIDEISDPEINRLLLAEFSKGISLGTWVNIFFKLLNVYKEHRDLLFVQELYDFYWDTSKSPHIPISNIRAPFERLVQIRNGLAHQPTGNWHLLFDDAFGLLGKILKEFEFIAKYNLVHVIKDGSENCRLDNYSGVNIKQTKVPCTTTLQLTNGWFYLSNKNQSFLPLHPLLIGWQGDEILPISTTQYLQDTGLFDQFQRSGIDYITSSLGQKVRVKDSIFIEEFVINVIQNIEKAKEKEKVTKRLSWALLNEIAIETSQRKMSSVTGKYNPTLYLQRGDILKSFDEFLKSDKVCFVLTGKSGIGKTNFLLALLNEYHTTESDVCLLFYNGAKLTTNQNISDVISRDFMALLQQKSLKGFNVTDPWMEINRIDEMENKKVVLFIEALNENPDAKGLLKHIDSLVENTLWPWLKIVIVARTEAWRLIRQGIQIAESRYYRSSKSTEQIGVEMQPFTFSDEIRPFTGDELRTVYGKYKSFYKLQTNFDDLPVEVKIAFRDPLVLRLMADTYQNRDIPHVIDVNDLYQKYIDNLITTGRLAKDDVFFLEQQLMPLMINEEIYANKIKEDLLVSTRTKSGEKLFDMLFTSKDMHASQTYLNLVDSEILAQQGSEVSYEIVFKYERFYDYFAARRLQYLFGKEIDKPAKYQQILLQLKETPFLWGAVRKILLDILDEERIHILPLIYLKGQVIQKMMVEVMVEYGKRGGEQTEIVKGILLEIVKRNRIQSPLIGLDYTGAKFIAVDAAVELGLVEILGITSGDLNASVRTHTAIVAAECWKLDYSLGEKIVLEITERLAYKLPIVKLPNLRVFETLIALVFMLFLRHYHDQRSTAPLTEVIRRVYTTIIPVNPNSNVGRGISAFIFQLLFSAAIGLLEKATSDKPQYTPANLYEVATYFSRPQNDRNLMLDVLRLFYVDSSRIEEFSDVFSRVVALDDGDVNWAVTHLISRHGLINPAGTTRILADMFDKQMSKERPSYHASFLLEAFSYFLERLNPKLDETVQLFYLYEQMVKKYTSCQ